MLIALPAWGSGFFYHDTWLPGIESILSQGEDKFSPLLPVTGWSCWERFINWEMVGIGFVMLTMYLFLAQWLRFTPWVLAALLWLWLSPQLSRVLPETNAPASNVATQPVKRSR